MNAIQVRTNQAGATATLSELRPRTNLSETPEGYLLECALPGVAEKDVQVELEGNVLSLRAEGRIPEAAGDMRVVRAELAPAVYARSFRLGEGLDPASVKASLKHGLLRIEVRRATPVQRRIDVQAG